MGHTTDLLDDVRHRIAAHDLVLGETRTRLQLVRDAAISVPGARRTYGSGSLAQHTVNHPVTDGDGGLVLDRRTYPELGPDGGGETPTEVAGKVCELLGPAVRQVYPKARCGTSKRGPKVWFGQSLQGQDPTIDLVVALTRRVGSGLWIPNLEKRTWEASDPERHTDLLNGGPAALRRTRRRVIRLAKAWNKQFAQPGLSSFNISAIALASVQPGLGLAEGLQRFFADGAASLATGRNTPDPAGVSPPLKLLMPRTTVVRRLRAAADAVADALTHDDDPGAVQAALHQVFWDYVDAPGGSQLPMPSRRCGPAPQWSPPRLGWPVPQRSWYRPGPSAGPRRRPGRGEPPRSVDTAGLVRATRPTRPV